MGAYIKRIIHHPHLHIINFTKRQSLPSIIFVHGGPGLNCGTLEYLIEHEAIFDTLAFDLILYDQRGCGRSNSAGNQVKHDDNICDLKEVYEIITENKQYEVAAIAGHSYGAKVLFDYLQTAYTATTSGIFISMSPSILTPRINNLLIDLAYLKSVDETQYAAVLEEFDNFSFDKLWLLTERLSEIFKKNENRPYFYWANLKWRKQVNEIHKHVSMPINTEVFKSVREDLYSNPNKYSVDVNALTHVPILWINGFHDLVMNAASALTKESDLNQRLFFKSAHYPHIEEHEKFCGEVNAFLKNT